jgi:hypothetical protein
MDYMSFQKNTFHGHLEFQVIVYVLKRNRYLSRRSSAVSIGTSWTPEGSSFESEQGQKFSFIIIQTAHPASPPIGTGVSKYCRFKKKVDIYTHFSIRLRGVPLM